ncbi:MAG: adenosine deaminase [Syntrophobacterales bacterium]|nr:MAG: adenosine deaminase [Syntrophobacterales bacterium]
MRYPKILVAILLTGILSGCSSIMSQHTSPSMNSADNSSITARFYESMFVGGNPDVAKLNLFFTTMPKGGDIHHHYTGTLYAETYLEWVAKKDWRIDSRTLRIVTDRGRINEEGDLITVQQLLADDTLYRKLLTLWSDKDYRNHSHNQPPPDSNFFSTFGYFGAVSDEYMDVGLNILKQRALKENVAYIETMLTRVGVRGADYFDGNTAKALNQLLRNAKSQEETNTVLDRITATLLGDKRFISSVSAFVTMVENNHRGIDDNNFVMRYQTYAVRVLDPIQVFTDLLSGYLAAEKSPLVVGVNIVAPENNTVALADYTLHMRMYNYLLGKYPDVNRDLHAGELTLGMVRPKDLTFHIQQARDIAQAQRIGHGVDLPYEQHCLELLKDLKENAAVEINLTSNEFIMGVEGNNHPYRIYSDYGVPLVIATDDSGVSRNNLANEYVLLASRYHPPYGRIKEYVYNSIQYSFLEPADKISLKSLLDKRFLTFETEMANLYKNLRH